MSRGWPGGSTRRYRRIRELVMLRDGRACQIRLAGVCVGRADCAHHTLGRAATGDDPRYMVAACTPCNLKVGDPSVDPPIAAAMTRW